MFAVNAILYVIVRRFILPLGAYLAFLAAFNILKLVTFNCSSKSKLKLRIDIRDLIEPISWRNEKPETYEKFSARIKRKN